MREIQDWSTIRNMQPPPVGGGLYCLLAGRCVRDDVHECAADHGAVGGERHLPHVLGVRDAEADGDRQVAMLPDALHQRRHPRTGCAARPVMPTTETQ